jgi:hypothetical protein
MSHSPFEPWLLNEQTEKVLGLPLITLTPTARPWANTTQGLWLAPVAHMAIWQGPAMQHGFYADSLDEALECVEQRAGG